jgi:transposase InsO family protein
MPWRLVDPMTERLRFITDARRRIASFSELCARYGVSRKTGYKWLHRADRDGTAVLAEASRRPLTCPHATPGAIVDAVLAVRRQHPAWGPRKLLKLLRRRSPRQEWPGRSTVADLLRRHGLVEPRRRRRYPGHPGRPTTPMTAPNGIWTADFKGQFKTGDGIYCYPLTVQDGFSRYLLACRGLTGTTYAESRPVFERLFREYGLPEMLRTDNGVPFATGALGRLSQLSVWWVRLGIYPELIQPGQPQQNGRHERMHRTLKRATARPAAATRRQQQRCFDVFRREYNELRPHEALADETPASVYRPSPRPYPTRLPPLEYPAHFEVRRVSRNGGVRWHKRWVNVSHVLGGEYVGFTEVDDREWDLYFGPLRLGRFHERTLTVEDALGRLARRRVLPMSLD